MMNTPLKNVTRPAFLSENARTKVYGIPPSPFLDGRSLERSSVKQQASPGEKLEYSSPGGFGKQNSEEYLQSKLEKLQLEIDNLRYACSYPTARFARTEEHK